MQTKNYKSTKFNIFKNIQISNPSCYNNFSFSFIVFPIACYFFNEFNKLLDLGFQTIRNNLI